MSTKTRVWAAVLDDNGEIVCDVRDVDDGVINWGTPEYRSWRFCDVDFVAGNDPKCKCVPGQPCRKCRKIAEKWWHEWAGREAARCWAAEKEPTPGRWAASDYCGHKHPSRVAAERCAASGGFALVVLRNGHGKVLERLPAGAPPSLFGVSP